MNRTRLVRQSLSSQSSKDPAGLEGAKGLRCEPVLPRHTIFFSFVVVVAVVYWFCCFCFILALPCLICRHTRATHYVRL